LFILSTNCFVKSERWYCDRRPHFAEEEGWPALSSRNRRGTSAGPEGQDPSGLPQRIKVERSRGICRDRSLWSGKERRATETPIWASYHLPRSVVVFVVYKVRNKI